MRTAVKQEPKITEIPGPVLATVNGRAQTVDRIIYMDYGPKLGCSVTYITHTAQTVDLDAVDRLIGRYGVKLDRESIGAR